MGLQIEKDIIPLSRFRASYKQYIDSLKESNRSIVLTQNGRASAVVLSPQEYDKLNETQEVMSLIASRLQEIANHQFAEEETAMWMNWSHEGSVSHLGPTGHAVHQNVSRQRESSNSKAPHLKIPGIHRSVQRFSAEWKNDSGTEQSKLA